MFMGFCQRIRFGLYCVCYRYCYYYCYHYYCCCFCCFCFVCFCCFNFLLLVLFVHAAVSVVFVVAIPIHSFIYAHIFLIYFVNIVCFGNGADKNDESNGGNGSFDNGNRANDLDSHGYGDYTGNTNDELMMMMVEFMILIDKEDTAISAKQ